jgi:hypothetical protein
LLALPVRIRGIHVGRPTALLVDRHADLLLGFEVSCGDRAHRFLPVSVARDLDFNRRLDACGFANPEIDEHGGIHEARNAA